MGAVTTLETQFPFEELIPATVIKTYGSGKYAHLSELLFTDIAKEARLIDFEDILIKGPHLPGHKCSFKWANRTFLAPETNALTTEWGLDVLTAANRVLAEGDPLVRHRLCVLLENLASFLRSRGAVSKPENSVTHIEESGGGVSPVSPARGSYLGSVIPSRQTVDLTMSVAPTFDGERDLHIVFENTGANLNLDIQIERMTDTYDVSILSGRAIKGDDGFTEPDHRAVQGHVYLEFIAKALFPIVRITSRSKEYAGRGGFDGRIIFSVSENFLSYIPNRRNYEADSIKDYYVIIMPPNEKRFLIGLPFRELEHMSYLVEIVYS